jgi:hypothetical protein
MSHYAATSRNVPEKPPIAICNSRKLKIYLAPRINDLRRSPPLYSLTAMLTSPSGRELRKPQRNTNSFHPGQDTLT